MPNTKIRCLSGERLQLISGVAGNLYFVQSSKMPQPGLLIPSPENNYLANEIHLLLASYQQWLGEPLITTEYGQNNLALKLWEAPIAVVSHVALADPIFWYGNQTALRLFEMTWDEFITLPSRLSAEPALQRERERLLAEVRIHGFSKNYRGVRISKTGKRFQIENAVVWDLIDSDQNYCGQAATFDRWRFVEGN
jgi:hypothetical protein